MGLSPVLIWLRRDLRLEDHPAFSAAQGRAVIPVVIRDTLMDGLGAAPKWRLGLGLDHFAQVLQAKGLTVLFRSGHPKDVLSDLVAETGADSVYWLRAYDPVSVTRDTEVKTTLKSLGVTARSFPGHTLIEPWAVQTKTGGAYKVYTPFWKTVRTQIQARPLPPAEVTPDGRSFASENLRDWHLGRDMYRGADVLAGSQRVGAQAAQQRLSEFVAHDIGRYRDQRDIFAASATSGLSQNLALGEISIAQCWQAGRAALEQGCAGAEQFLKELVWREFAYHLMWHMPHMLKSCWKPEWDAFPWDQTQDEAYHNWCYGQTGVPLVDAAMRELYITGTMHNRARMIAASYLTKNLRKDWRLGLAWFENCLTDWDMASNAMGWQWVAGCGADAAPFFRIFNPLTQAEKFDADGAYVSRWLGPEQQARFNQALPPAVLSRITPPPTVGKPQLSHQRKIALEMYQQFRTSQDAS